MISLPQCLPDWLETGLRRPVAVFGWGRSGKAAASLVAKLEGEAIVYDEGGHGSACPTFDEEAARQHALVVCSPAFDSGHPWMKAARDAGCELIAEFDLGALLWEGPIVAVTGTNGKTTLTAFLTEAFQQSGIESYALGNIGKPMCEALVEEVNREAVAVCEISSFQAEQMRSFRADHVLWTNFDEDHLDRHQTMQSYFRSKYSLISNARGETKLVDRSVFEYGKRIGVDFPESSVVSDNDDPERLGLVGTVFETQPELRTYSMARALWKSLQLDEAALVRAANAFRKSPHRIERLNEVEGVVYWNDSKATNFHAVYGALDRFQEPVFWIGGGKDKGGDLDAFVHRIAPKIACAATIGETGPRLAASLNAEGVDAVMFDSLEAAASYLNRRAKSGDNVLLSPGFASFDMFKGYEERGEVFRKAVDCLQSERSMNDV